MGLLCCSFLTPRNDSSDRKNLAMFILGLQGSPRNKGNTGILLSAFMEEAKRLGAITHIVDVAGEGVTPCLGCGVCEKKGYCPIDDNMQEIYFLLRRADIIVMATPIYFYGPTAQLKALIDRTQALWARSSIHKLADPGTRQRKGVLLAVGATKGKNLFDGTMLSSRYFFYAAGAEPSGAITVRQVDKAGEINNRPDSLDKARKLAVELVSPYLVRKRALFIDRENICQSQMAGAFARLYYGDEFEVETAGTSPGSKIDPIMEEVMMEKGIDMAWLRPKSLEEASASFGRPADMVISMGCGDQLPQYPGAEFEEWGLHDPSGKSIDSIREIRDSIFEKVRRMRNDE